MDIAGAIGIVLSIAGIIFFIPIVSKLLYQPRFEFGFLPLDPKKDEDIPKAGQGTRLDFRNWKRQEELTYKCKDNRVRVPMIVSNQGRGDVEQGMVYVEYFERRNLTLEEVHTEYLKVYVAYGPRDHFGSENLLNKAPESEIVEYYDSIRMKGNFLQFAGNMPSKTYEVVLFDFYIKKPITVDFKIRVRTPDRLFQQRCIRQRLKFAV